MSQFDNDLQVGDIITAYRKGFHKVVSIRRRFYKNEREMPSHLRNIAETGDEYKALVEYLPVMSAAGKILKSKKTHSCDAGYCVKVDATFIAERRAEASAMWDALENMLP